MHLKFKFMQSFFKKIAIIAVLIGILVCVSIVRAAIIITPAKFSSPTGFASTTGATNLRRAINAGKIRLTQLKQTINPAMGITHTLVRGSQGDEVKLLQQFLKFYGAFTYPDITGYFGLQTEQAVKKFQEKESIDSIGIVGPKTRARIATFSGSKLAVTNLQIATTSSDTATITDAILSTDVGEDGSGLSPVTVFASTSKNIYAIVTLANAKQDTQIGFIRYFNDTYVDSGVTHPSRSGLKYVHFQWALKSNTNRISGSYTIALYVNGNKSKTISFNIN